jgi:branched-chain amino acid transport system ATP-binding protein
MLEVSDLSACYGAVRVLQGITLGVRPGEVVALIGANGAGKTTLLHTVAGLHPVDSGTVMLSEQPATGQPAHELAHRGLCLVPAGRELFSDLTVAENLQMGMHGCGVSGGEARVRIREVYELFPILEEFAERPSGVMSGGQQQMLAIGRALVRRPTVLLLDEPSLGLAPLMVAQILDTVAGLARQGVAVLLAEQNAAAALRVSDRGIVLENGRITREDRADVLLTDEDVSRHYLGGSAGPALSTPRTLPADLDRLVLPGAG